MRNEGRAVPLRVVSDVVLVRREGPARGHACAAAATATAAADGDCIVRDSVVVVSCVVLLRCACRAGVRDRVTARSIDLRAARAVVSERRS